MSDVTYAAPGYYRCFGVHTFELRELRLRLLQALQIGRLHASVFGLPIVVGRVADPVAAAGGARTH